MPPAGVVKPFYRDAFKPLLKASPALKVTQEQSDLIFEVLETACSDSRFVQKAYEAIWYILTHGVDPLPTVAGIAPTSGVTLTPVTVTVTGTNFTPGSKVIFGGVEQVTTFVSPTSLTADVTLGAEGSVPVSVQAENGFLVTPPQTFTVTAVAGRSAQFEEKKLKHETSEAR